MTTAGSRTLPGGPASILQIDGPVHVFMMASMTVGTFQGYLKDRIPGMIPYVGADLCLLGAVGLVFAGMAIRHVPLAAPRNVRAILLAIILLPMVYLLQPGTTLLVKIAGLRSWVEFPVACLVALAVVRSAGQVRAYIGLILGLCLLTALYGILQYQTGPDAALGVSELAQLRHGRTTFYPGAGDTAEFRAFSTFTFPAPFATMMVFGLLLAAGIVVSVQRSRRARWIAGALMVPLFVGMTVSGTRASLVVLVAGLISVGWLRGLTARHLALVPALLLALHFSTVVSGGRVVGRYATLFTDERRLWTSVYAPITIAQRAIVEEPLGMGLGRSGVGVPFDIVRSMPPGYFVGGDGDVARAAVELGVLGLGLLLAIVVGLVPKVVQAARSLVPTDAGDIAVGVGALLIVTSIGILIGSPLTTTPHGTIWWFFLGAVIKLAMLKDGR